MSMARIESFLDRVGLRSILILALAVRLIWIAVCPATPVSDAFIYHDSATRLAHGIGFTDQGGAPLGWWPVGYPALLAGAYRIFGATPRVAYFLNALLGVVAVAGVHRLARELFGERSGRAAALLTATYPSFVLYSTVVLSENATIPIVVWLAWLFLRLIGGGAGRWRECVAAGLVLGAGTYVHASTLLLVLALPLRIVAMREPRRFALARALLAVGIAIATLVPWGLRNQREFGRFSLVSMNGMSNLWMGNHPGTDGGYWPLPAEYRLAPIPDREARLGAIAKSFIREHPGTYLILIGRRLWMTLRSDTSAAQWCETGIARTFGKAAETPLKILTSTAYYALLAWTLLVVTRRAWRREWAWQDGYLLSLSLLVAAPFALIVGGNRYHLPLLPLLMTWASVAWADRPLARGGGLEPRRPTRRVATESATNAALRSPT
jgi:4-amino-4-deoxy-L-arabinose transferase-like glycosyltransferase